MLKTTRPFLRILADAYWFFISFGLSQLALHASLYQEANCCSLSGNLSQNSLRVRLAITLKKEIFQAKINKVTETGTFLNQPIHFVQLQTHLHHFLNIVMLNPTMA